MYTIWSERPVPDRYLPLLEGQAELIGPWSDPAGDVIASLRDAEAAIASAGVRYDAALLDHTPALRVISRTGVGIDNIIVPDATARGIAVCYAPDAPTISTAEHTVALMLAAAKDLQRIAAIAREGKTTDLHTIYKSIELYGLRLGLIGLGRIGSRVAAVARALEMNVSAYDPFISAERAQALGVELVSDIDELLRISDIVSLHVPINEETYHLIDARRLALMKRGAILVNAARGGLVDEQALIEALDSGQIQAAGVDVFEHEPPAPDHPLLNRIDVVATPHVASGTAAGRDRLWRTAIIQALQVLRGEFPPHLVNPEVWELRRN